MRRSRVNQILHEGEELVRSFRFALPPFASWTPERLLASRASAPGVFAGRLGWDITDYGQGRWDTLGLLLFTIRNGELGSARSYCEKLLVSRRDQLAPMHRHHSKAEDIIHRGGGALVMQLFGSAPDGSLDEHAPVEVPCDGSLVRVRAGGKLVFDPGESVTLLPGIWHAFWAEGADVLMGEVSTVNDDVNDNVFREPIGRFSTIEEDEAPYRLLVSDYDAYTSGTSKLSAGVPNSPL